MTRLRDKVAIITGAAGGIGKAAAQLFAKARASSLILPEARIRSVEVSHAEEHKRRRLGDCPVCLVQRWVH
jgi:NAD(P)-dependent dehydrogenase (short-subunit alcohol dehydrogenase family)